MNEEWGTPISKEKIIYRRNKLIEYQKIGEFRFTPLYEVIDENILDINYMIYEIERVNNIINELEKWLKEWLEEKSEDEFDYAIDDTLCLILDKLQELKENNK